MTEAKFRNVPYNRLHKDIFDTITGSEQFERVEQTSDATRIYLNGSDHYTEIKTQTTYLGDSFRPYPTGVRIVFKGDLQWSHPVKKYMVPRWNAEEARWNFPKEKLITKLTGIVDFLTRCVEYDNERLSQREAFTALVKKEFADLGAENIRVSSGRPKEKRVSLRFPWGTIELGSFDEGESFRVCSISVIRKYSLTDMKQKVSELVNVF